MKTTNRTILDLNKVQHGSFWYVNQYGDISYKYPFGCFTVRNQIIGKNDMAYPHPDYPNEKAQTRAVRLNMKDYWTPIVTFQLTANHNIVYTGPKAVSMWKAWNEKIFNKNRKK